MSTRPSLHCLVIALAAIVGCQMFGVVGQTQAASANIASDKQMAPSPGIYTSPTPGVVSITGECKGKLTLTPFRPYIPNRGSAYALVYDCAKKTFEVLHTGEDLYGIGDLTLTNEGYYLHFSHFSDGNFQGAYHFYDHNGKQLRVLPRPESPKVHDFIVRDDSITYINYLWDWDSSRCVEGAPLDVEIVTEDLDGNVAWRWSSRGRFDLDDNVSTPESTHALPWGWKRTWLRAIRNCYSSLLRSLISFETPKWPMWNGKYPIFLIEEDDYMHVNSIQWLEPSGDILVSARHLDMIFRIDRKTGEVKWSLGGKFSKATRERPVDDPRGGFSHPHYARIYDNRLWVFDNANLFGNLPSRVVAYQLDSKPKPNRQVFEFLEPNGRQRYSLGSVELLKDDELLIGWGAVNTEDLGSPQRAVSIVRISDGKEVFAMDLQPPWISYRVKAWQP